MPQKRKGNDPDRDPPSENEAPTKKGRKASNAGNVPRGGRTTCSSTRAGQNNRNTNTGRRQKTSRPSNSTANSDSIGQGSQVSNVAPTRRTRAQCRQAEPPTSASAPAPAPMAPTPAAPAPVAAAAAPAPAAINPAGSGSGPGSGPSPRSGRPDSPSDSPGSSSRPLGNSADPSAAPTPGARPPVSHSVPATPVRSVASPRPTPTPLTREAADFFRMHTNDDQEFNIAHSRKLSKMWADPKIKASWIKIRAPVWAEQDRLREVERKKREEELRKEEIREAERKKKEEELRRKHEEETRLAAERAAELERQRQEHDEARQKLLASLLAEEEEAYAITKELLDEERRDQEKIERKRRTEAQAKKQLLRAKAVARTRREAEIAEATASQAAAEARFYKNNAEMALLRLTHPSSDAPQPEDPEPQQSKGRVEFPTSLPEGLWDKWKGKGKAKAVEEEAEENENDEGEEGAENANLQDGGVGDEEEDGMDEDEDEQKGDDNDDDDDAAKFFMSNEMAEGTVVNDLTKKLLASARGRGVTPTESDGSGSDFEEVSAQEKRKRAQKYRREVSDTEEEDDEEDLLLEKEAVPSSPRRNVEANANPAIASTTSCKPSGSSDRSQGGSVSKEVQAAASELGATIFRQVEDFATKSQIPVPVALKLVKMNMPAVRRDANIWNKFQFVLARREPIEGEDREAFIERARKVYRSRTDSQNSADQILAFFEEVEKHHMELIMDPANLKHPHVRALGITEDIRDMFIRTAQTQPDFIPVGILIYAGDDPAASAACSVITGSEIGKAILEKSEVPVQTLAKNLTDLFRGELAARNLGIATEVVKRQPAGTPSKSYEIPPVIPRRKRALVPLDPKFPPPMLRDEGADSKEDISPLLRARQGASNGLRLLLRTVNYEMGINVRWQLLASIAFEKQMTWFDFPRIKGRCPEYNSYNTQNFNLADWQLLETAFNKRTIKLKKWTQVESSYKPGTAEYNVIPLVVAPDGVVECSVGSKQLYEAYKQRKKLNIATNKLIPLPNYALHPPEPPVVDEPAPAPTLSPRSEILMLRAELEKLGGAKVTAFNFEGYKLVSPSGSGTGDPQELFQMHDDDDTAAYHKVLSKARQPEFVQGTSKPPKPKKPRFLTPRFGSINYMGKKPTPPSGRSLRVLPIKKSTLGKPDGQAK